MRRSKENKREKKIQFTGKSAINNPLQCVKKIYTRKKIQELYNGN